ncbi:MAG: Abi family protein [Oscillospiraceae bacterium]|nr:Abi family protein [Candidatus Limimonas coprohippi]
MKKPMLSAEEMVEKLDRDKGIKFELASKEEAIEHLKKYNNYLRTASYRINYEKRNDKYVNLDFAYLIELARLDMHLRTYLLKMAIDIEHSLKLKILEMIENCPSEDGYSIVSDFLLMEPKLLSSICNKRSATFTKDLIKKHFRYDETSKRLYNNDCPVWALVEVISFGDLVKLYNYCCDRCDCPNKDRIDKKVLNLVKSCRNACAHNNCILRDLRKKQDTYPPQVVSMYASRIQDIGKEKRQNKLKVRSVLEIVSLFYCYEKLVPDNTRCEYEIDLKKFAEDRLIKNIEFFKKNEEVESVIMFIKSCIDILN